MEFADAELIADFVVESQEGLATIEQRMLGSRPDDLDRDVLDAIGELTNMIAGNEKTKLEQYQMTIGLPMVVCGKAQAIAFPSQAQPIVIPFDSPLGSVCVQVGLVESAPG